MAIADCKITNSDIQGVNVKSRPTILRGSAEDNKDVFDAYSDMIVEHFNDLCDEVDADTSAEIAVSVLALYEALGWIQD